MARVALPVPAHWRRPARSKVPRALKRFLAHKMAVVGLGALALLVLGATLAPLLTPYGPREQDLFNTLAPPSLSHPLGTDALGRDHLTRLLYGGRVSLSVGLLSTAVAVMFGTIVGSLAGMFGGVVDRFLMRLIDLMLVFPPLILLILFASLFGTSYLTIVLVLGAVSWMTVGRLVRASFLELKPKDFVEASRALGCNNYWICIRHILPNSWGPVIVAATLNTAAAIITESTLSFLGLGIQPPLASWGNMLQNAQVEMMSAPWTAISPGLLIFLTVLSINFVGDGLRDALDPRQVIG